MGNLRITLRLWVVAVVLAIVLSGLTVAGVTSATDRAAPEFVTSKITDQRGDIVRIPVRMADSGSADVRITGRSIGYEATVTLRDRDNDGRVFLEFNTYHAGSGKAFRTVGGSDQVIVYSQSDVDGLVPAGMYRLLTDDGESTADLDLQTRSTDEIQASVAPDDAYGRLRTSDAISRYREAGNLTGHEDAGPATVAQHDTLVLRIRATGLSGVLAAQPGTNDSERFRSLVESDVVSLAVEETAASSGQEPARLLLDREGVRYVVDARTDRYYVVVDTSAVSYDRDGEELSGLQPGDGFAVDFTVTGDSKLNADGPESASVDLDVVERSATIETDEEAGQYFLSPERGQSVRGTTTVAPGSRMDVRIGSPNGDLDVTQTVTVSQSDGGRAFEMPVDLGQLRERSELTATASDHRGTLTDDPLRVTVRSPEARLNEPSLEVAGSQLYATVRANLSRGGVVTVRANNGSGRLLGAAAVEPGQRTVKVPLEDLPEKNTPLIVTALRDMDGDGAVSPSVDVPYEQSDSPRPVQATVTLFTLPPSPTPSPTSGTATTAPPGATPSDATPGTSETTAPPTTSPPSGDDQLPVNVPGLGTVVALTALGVALLVFGRRQ